MGNLREHELHSAQVAELGFIPGACHYAGKGSAVPYGFLRDNRRIPASRLHTSIVDAKTAAGEQNGNNNVVFLTPDSHTQAAALVWAANMTHLVGMYPEAMMNQRARIGHSATLATMLTVSGYGNLFKNLYFMYGLDNATDLNLLTISGGRNTFRNVHFLPGHATPLDEAGFDLVRIGSNEQYFKNCVFGSDSVAMSAGNLVEFMASSDPPRSVFENCLFIVNADAAGVTFLKAIAGLGRCLIMFKNCQFINLGTTMTLGIDGTGLGNAKMAFDQNCFFYGVTDICTNTKDTNIICGMDYGASADESNLIAGFADHTA